jgi:lipid-binding SYLF domain-containing protein
MKNWLSIAILFAGLVLLNACAGKATQSQFGINSSALVASAQATIETLKRRDDIPEFKKMLKRAHGIMIFPALYKAGFIVGAEGGNGVMLSRDAAGNWGYPAFYTLAAGSFGFQAGGQRARAAFIVRSAGAVKAIIDHQGKLGANAGISVGHVGAGIEGSVTTNLALDVVAFSDVMGLFGGVSLEGAAMIRRNDYNDQYYGRGATPESILLAHAHRNPQADALRASLLVR